MTADSIEDALRSLEVRVSAAERASIGAGGLLPLADGAITLAYVVDGELTTSAPGDGCELDLRHGGAERATAERTLLAGDAFLWLGVRPNHAESASGATVMTAELELEHAAAAHGLLPDFAYVTGFARSEPAAAALAAQLGADTAHGGRTGDPIICRMMATTVLFSLVRAWAAGGCAPDGWPARHGDPFLAGVIDAIHAEPGRSWSIEQLAALAAMSRSVFTTRFRAAYGRSPAGYVTSVRMDEARRMLADGLPVSSVSRDLGYGSDEGFSRAFRRETGMAPSRWRADRATSIA